MAKRSPSPELPRLKREERITQVDETQLKRFDIIKEYLLLLKTKRPIHIGSPVFSLDRELEYQNLIVIGQNSDGTFTVARKSKPDFPVKNLAAEVLFDQQDFVDANREAWRRFPQMLGEQYIGPPTDEDEMPKGRE